MNPFDGPGDVPSQQAPRRAHSSYITHAQGTAASQVSRDGEKQAKEDEKRQE